MSKSPSQRSLVNPGQVPDARYFGDRKTRLKRTRTEPLPGTKTPMPSTNDGGLSQLVTMQARAVESQPCLTSRALGWMCIGFAALLLVFSYTSLFIHLPGIVTLTYFAVFVLMHGCALCAHLSSEAKFGLGPISLVIYYGGLILCVVIYRYWIVPA